MTKKLYFLNPGIPLGFNKLNSSFCVCVLAILIIYKDCFSIVFVFFLRSSK